MRNRIGYIFIAGLLFFNLLSCSPSQEIIETRIFETQSSWTVPPTYTYNPTYTFQPTGVKEVTRIVVVTETEAPTSLFSATISPTRTLPRIWAQGSGTVKAFINKAGVKMSYFDLDTGKNVADETSDLNFWVSCGSGCFPEVSSINGAISFVFGRQEPSYEDCVENMFSENYGISYKYICFRTNSNNYSVFKIILYCSNGDGSDTVTFLYKTWKQPENLAD